MKLGKENLKSGGRSLILLVGCLWNEHLEMEIVLRCSEMGLIVLIGGISRQEESMWSGVVLGEKRSVLSFKSRVGEGTASRQEQHRYKLEMMTSLCIM